MNDELKYCPFKIGDQVKVNTNSQVFIGWITGIEWHVVSDDWMFAVSKHVNGEGIPKLGPHFKFSELELIERPLCPDTLESTGIETLNSDNMVRAVMRYGGRCRDCADECGLCPHSQLPCETDDKETAIKSVIDAISYYLKNPQYLKGEL